MRPRTAATIERQLDFFKEWLANAKTWLKPDGTMYKPGETIKLPNLAKTLRKLVASERAAKAKGLGRKAAIIAARNRFYKGDIARDFAAFLKAHKAPYELSDFSEFYAKLEEPTSTDYRGYTVYKQ